MIKIENGVKKLQNGSYQYDYWAVIGPDDRDETITRSEFKSVVFTAQPEEVPEIGDFINGTTLVKRDDIQVTEGRMRWPTDYGGYTTDWSSDHEPSTGWDKSNR